MTIEEFKQKLKTEPETLKFSDTMSVIQTHYNFTPTAFKNGALQNNSAENLGSCKLLAFAKAQDFNKEETLACFGQFYFEDVLKNPNLDRHQNIRNFMNTGFEGLSFDGDPLKTK